MIGADCNGTDASRKVDNTLDPPGLTRLLLLPGPARKDEFELAQGVVAQRDLRGRRRSDNRHLGHCLGIDGAHIDGVAEPVELEDHIATHDSASVTEDGSSAKLRPTAGTACWKNALSLKYPSVFKGAAMAGTAFSVDMPIRFSHSDPAGIVYYP